MLFSRFSLLLLSAASFSSVVSQGLTGTSEVAPLAGVFDLEKRAPIPAPPQNHRHRPTPHRKPKHRKPKHRRPSHRPSHGHGHGQHSHGHGHHQHPSRGHGHGHHHGHGGHGHGHGHGGHGGHSSVCKPSKCHQLIPDHAHHICSRNECAFACNDGFRFNGKKCVAGPPACKASKCRNRLPPHAYRVCRAGHCDFSCTAGYYRDGNSCKFGLDLRHDAKNCGAVGHVCPADYLGVGTPQCVNGHCKLRCPTGSTYHAGPPAFCTGALIQA